MFQIRPLRSKIADGTFIAPQIFFALMVNGSGGGLLVDSPTSARAVVTMAKTQDYDFIKVYNELSAEVFNAILDEAKNNGISVIGHGVRSVGLLASLMKGQVMIAHVEEFYYTDFDRKRNVAAIPDMVEMTYQSEAFVTPNLSAFEVMDHQWGKPEVFQGFLLDPRIKYISPEMRLYWRYKDYIQRSGSISLTFDFLKLFTKALSDRGVPSL